MLRPAAAGEFPQGLKPNSPRTCGAAKPRPFKACCLQPPKQMNNACEELLDLVESGLLAAFYLSAENSVYRDARVSDDHVAVSRDVARGGIPDQLRMICP